LFYLRYLGAELRRRKGRTLLAAISLALGVGLVVVVTALSTGLDDAQSKVLEPLTGVGTEMSVTRPMQRDADGGPPPPGEGGGPINFDDLGKAGEKFDTYRYMSMNTSFSSSKQKRVEAVDGVESTAAGLTLNVAHVSGKVPEQAEQSPTGAPPTGSTGGGPNSIDLDSMSVSGIDASSPDLGLLTRSQIVDGTYLTGHDSAVVSSDYATQNDLGVGDEVEVGAKSFEIVGISEGAVDGQSSDVYVGLGTLQKLADMKGQVNTIQVAATSADQVDAVASRIESAFSGASVTTASDVADQVSGSLVDAKSLSGKLGTALAVVALLGAFGITTLVTLSSINKRARELGTLKAIGWRQWLVVRQVTGESVATGLIGGLIRAVIGIAAAALIGAAGDQPRRLGQPGRRRRSPGPGRATGPGRRACGLRSGQHRRQHGGARRSCERGDDPAGDRPCGPRWPPRRGRGRHAHRSPEPRRSAEEPRMSEATRTKARTQMTNATSEYLYRLESVTKVYGSGSTAVRALDGIDLEIAPGEMTVVVGSSGSGKSTLLQLLGGLDRLSAGRIELEGVDLSRAGEADLAEIRLRKVGFVFQQFNLIPTLTARENVEVAAAPLGPGSDDLRSRAEAMLARVGLTDRVDHLPSELSGGEQQRVAIARALVNEPDVLLADEPTGHLDSTTGGQILDLLRELWRERGMAIVLITHDPSIAADAPRVIRLADGAVDCEDREPVGGIR
jgi:putative ABC transport system permease protein